jgi:hypothetical protein
MLNCFARILGASAVAVLVTACAPAGTSSVQVYNPAWSGPIESMALLMEPPGRALLPLAEPTYSIAQAHFARHPYARQRFDLVERARLDVVMRELGLGLSGLVDASTAPRVGQLVGARYVLVLTLTEAEIIPISVGGPIEGIPVRLDLVTLYLTLSARLVDVETGRIVAFGVGSGTGQQLVGFAVDSYDFGSQATRNLVLRLVPEAARSAFEDLFRQIS